MKAVETNNLERARFLVEQGADKEGDWCDRSPLWHASYYGHFDMVQYLVE